MASQSIEAHLGKFGKGSSVNFVGLGPAYACPARLDLNTH